MVRVGGTEEDAKTAAVREQRAQQVLLVPVASFLDDPLPGIFVRQEHVVHMDANARCEPRQHFEEEMVHVAAGLRDVRGIDEQDVARFEGEKHVQGHVLHFLHDQAREPRQAGAQERLGEWFDGGELDATREVARVDVGHEQRRVAAAHLDDAPRLPVAHERVERAAVEPAELVVAHVEARGIAAFGQGLGIVELGQVAGEGFLQQPLVARGIEIDSRHIGRVGPQARGTRFERRGIDDGRIEVAVGEGFRRVHVREARRRRAFMTGRRHAATRASHGRRCTKRRTSSRVTIITAWLRA